MKNKNGFTLIELLVTIALIAAVSVVVGFSVNNLLYNQKKSEYDDFVKTMEDAACVFAEEDNRSPIICANWSTQCEIHFRDLIESGVVKKTLRNPFDDRKKADNTPYTINDDDASYVQVEYDSEGRRTCKFIDKGCNTSKYNYCEEKAKEK